jgi:TPR repeat protein
LRDGAGVPKDLVEAAKFLKRSADGGNALGQYNYALALQKDEGIIPDLLPPVMQSELSIRMAEAEKCFKSSADRGNADAQYQYGRALQMGEGVSKNAVQPASYFKMSAD